MFDFWDHDLTEEETERLLERAHTEIVRRRLTSPAILALEMHKPLCFLGAHGAVAFAPMLIPILGYDFVHDYSRLIAKRSNIERLLTMLEQNPHTASAKEEPCPN